MFNKRQLAQIAPEHLLNKRLSQKPHNYLCLYVELLNHKRIWYRASPKLEYAVKQHQQLSKQLAKQNNQKYEPDLYKILNNRYINVPLTPYFGHKKGIIGVGKIIRFDFKYVQSDLLCTRSQFIEPDQLKHLLRAYHYLRHDYNKYSRLNIFVDLWNWKAQLKKVGENNGISKNQTC